jgi:hypothetical protein
MTGEYKFGKYKLRPATDADTLMAARWVSADPWHATTTKPDFFLSKEKGIESYVLEDETGPVFFFRMMRVVRLDIQFMPEAEDAEHERTRDGLIEGVNWLTAALAIGGVHQIMFQSENPLLIRSAEKRLGFTRSPHELVREIFSRRQEA